MYRQIKCINRSFIHRFIDKKIYIQKDKNRDRYKRQIEKIVKMEGYNNIYCRKIGKMVRQIYRQIDH